MQRNIRSLLTIQRAPLSTERIRTYCNLLTNV